MAINIRSLLKDSLTFNLVGVITKVLMAISMIFAAKTLGPEDFGIYGLILLWSQYIGLVKPGFLAQAIREIPVLERENKNSYKIQNIAITGELIFAIFPTIILVIASFFYVEIQIRLSLFILSIVSIFVKLNDIWGSINIIRKRFKKVAIGRFISGMIGPLVIFIFIKDFGIYALVVYSGFASFASFIYYKRFSRIKFKFEFNKEILKNLFKDGIILQFLAISFWAFRLSDRTIISAFLSIEELGMYTFAASLALFLKNFVGEFHTVLQPIAWGLIKKDDRSSFDSLLKTVYFISVISFIFIPVSQLVFYIIVNYYSPEYLSASSVFNILSFSTYFIAVGGIVGIILNSGEIKKYKISLYYSIIGLFLNIVFDYLLIISGYGIFAIALVTFLVQSFIGMIQFIHIRTYLFNGLKDLLVFYVTILLPFLILAFLFYYLNQSFIIVSLNNGIINVLIPIFISSAGLLILKKTSYET